MGFFEDFEKNEKLSSKNFFSRGDFDEYKISDEQLKAHGIGHLFNKDELIKREKKIEKIYEQICKDTGLDMATVVNKYRITKDGCYYDIENPTEKFYYDLKTKFDEAELVEKSAKYIKRWFSNGEWHYKYPSKYKANQNRTETKKDIAQSTKLITGIEPLRNPTEQEIDEALVQLSLYAINGKMKCRALGNHSVYVSDKTQEHIKETHGKPRIIPEIKHKAKYIPFVPELLKNGKIAEKSSSSKGVIYGIVGQVEYVNDKNKKVKEVVELAINYDKDTRKFVFSFSDWEIKKSLLNNRDLDNSLACPIVDTETVPITVYSLSETSILSSGTVNTAYVSDKNNIKNKILKKKIGLVWSNPTSLDLSKSLMPSNSKSISSIPRGLIKGTSDSSTIPQTAEISSGDVNKSMSDKLFALWTRRLSPEFCNELKKLMHDDEGFRLIPKKVYEIPGCPKGQDLENCDLLELSYDYFVISCGGDWQDEKLVKFTIGDDDKLSAKVIDTCEKENKAILKNKLAYIHNPDSIDKSLFIDWKAELKTICKEKNLDYEETFKKYDTSLLRKTCEVFGQDAENCIAYKACKDLNKSLTFSGYKLQGRTRLYGMDISIENKKGSYRSGTDKDGHKWKTFMHYDYGYIRGTIGVDKDHVDVYIGPDKEAQKVYVIHQNDPVTHKYDEDKCMLCFSSADEAKKAYLKQYDRPGFFGSMETFSIEQFKDVVFNKKGEKVVKPDYDGEDLLHKSFTFLLTGITENNKARKIEQLEKALTAISCRNPFILTHAEVDDSKKYNDIEIHFRDFNKSKIADAVDKVALELDEPLKAAKGEPFRYKAQEDLTNQVVRELTSKTAALYRLVIEYFGLPEANTVQKAFPLTYKGKVLYNPETGVPITRNDWQKFLNILDKFLNRNYTGQGERIILRSDALGRIMSRMLENQKRYKENLQDIRYKGKTFDWISDSVKNMKTTFGDSITRSQAAKIQIAQQSCTQRIKKVTENVRNDIQQILIDGIKDQKSRSQVAQDLFNRCHSLNRDFQKIADTEIQEASSKAYIAEELYNSEPGEKVYFKRIEVLDVKTCKFCRQINGTIALWSNTPLSSEKIVDDIATVAIWEGKRDGIPAGCCHPYCRGAWIRYYPEIERQAA